MARCPACDQQVSPSADECPHCGIQIVGSRGGGGGGGSKNTLMIVLAVLAGVAVMFMCLIGIGLALFLPAVGQAREAARRVQSKNNLKQLGLALHNYHDINNTFPPAGTFTADNKPYQSWQTMILPLVDQAPVYGRIDQSAAWDDPRNRMAFTIPVTTYHNPQLGAPGQRFTTDGLATSHYAMNSKFGGPNQALQLSKIIDGTSNTLMAGEVGSGFLAWGDPQNARDPAQGLGASSNQFGGAFKGGAHMLLGDGAVKFISESVDPKVLEALSTPGGNETIDSF